MIGTVDVGIHRARELGVPDTTLRRRIDDGTYVEVTPRSAVYRIAAAAPSPDEDVWRAALVVGGDVVVARHSAAALHGLEPTPRSDGIIHLLVGERSFTSLPPDVVVHRSPHIVARWDVVEVRGLRCTSVARTLCDLARDVPPTLLVALVNDAVRKGLTNHVELRRMCTRLGRFRWKRRLLRILDALEPQASDARNATESRLLELCREAGLPLVGINVPMRDDAGRQRYIDAVLSRPDGRLLPVEVDGHLTHWTAHDRERDTDRAASLLRANARLLPFVRVRADEVWHDEDAVIARLREATADVDCAADPRMRA